MKIILLTLILGGCSNDIETENLSQHPPSDITDESLNRSIKSLDRTIKMMDKMSTDLEKMNNNLDAIFRAVTDCKADAECHALKEEYMQKYEENSN